MSAGKRREKLLSRKLSAGIRNRTEVGVEKHRRIRNVVKPLQLIHRIQQPIKLWLREGPTIAASHKTNRNRVLIEPLRIR